MTTTNTTITMTRRMLVACKNAIGEPDFFPCKVTGDDPATVLSAAAYDAAEKDAALQDYVGPYIVYDCDHDPAGSQVANGFNWDDVSIVTIQTPQHPPTQQESPPTDS